LESVVCVATGESDWTGPIGLVSHVAAAQYMDFGSVDVYLCGPPPMIELAQMLLITRGARRERLFAERFVPAQP
jgi:NAD(P)H-flavin reductase